MPSWFPIVASTLLAVIPVIIWLRIISKRGEGEKKSVYIKTFLAGTLAVIPPFILIFLFEKFPELNFYEKLAANIEQAATLALVTNIAVAIIEELGKNAIVRVIDKKHPEHVQTIGSALKLSICAGLGFSFAENIFYFYNIWMNYGYSDLMSAFIFRSLFTMCGHMIFSGIFGYYFGVGKFAADITEEARLSGKWMLLSRILGKLPGKNTFTMVREQMNAKGLILAIGIHAAFNSTLDLGSKLPSILIALTGGLFVAYLFNAQSGRMIFSMGKRRESTMAGKDQDAVMELLGMWTKKGKYEEVMAICDRLLKRDPDNNVVKLFKAKAADNQKLRQVYNSLKGVFIKQQARIPTKDVSLSTLNTTDEKTVLEVMDMWFKEGNYKQVLTIAENLLKRNPESTGAKLLFQQALDKSKLERVFESLAKLFSD
ncbi:MAG: PrsW family glutamic-type intramembrane protease [Candidatus Gracilibacteria bacterium]